MRWMRNRYCVSVPPSFFIHFLLKKRKVFCFFFLSFSSLVFRLLFVRLCIRCSGWCYLRCMYYYHIREQTLFISSAFIKHDVFLLRSNRLIDYFFSTVASITFIQQWCCHFVGSSIPAATRRYARRRWRRRFRLLVAILLRSWRLLCLTI